MIEGCKSWNKLHRQKEVKLAEGLAIITGIAFLVFLLFYLAFSIRDEDALLKIIKVFIIVFGLFLLTYIPQITITLERDCGILTNGSYICYLSNGSQVTNFSNPGNIRNVGTGLYLSYLWFLWLTISFTGIYAIYKAFEFRRFKKFGK